MEYSENTRVKIPALVHLTRLGYKYISLKEKREIIDIDTNIFKDIFLESINRINKTNYQELDIEKIINELKILLENEDLGKAFYKVIINGLNGIKLIDFDNIDNNSFNFVTELTYKNEEDEFRPDIIVLINGLPLSFIEVKKPNNREGILSERNRINTRFRNPKFRKFANITQLLVFSNNNEYDEESIVPIQGAFYATSSYQKIFFNCFREEDNKIINSVMPINQSEEEKILIDTNYVTLKGTPEYNTNLNINTPTNRIITSLFNKERILKILKYGIAYVEKTDKNGIIQIQKHIMRYPQIFATLSIEKKISQGINKGIIWHTQGSGKSFSMVMLTHRLITDPTLNNPTIIVLTDRNDLDDQLYTTFSNAKEYLRNTPIKITSRKDLLEKIEQTKENGIFFATLQKIDKDNIVPNARNNIIVISDEAHRSHYGMDEKIKMFKNESNEYNLKTTYGYEKHLRDALPNATFIGFSGTPVQNKDKDTTSVFG